MKKLQPPENGVTVRMYRQGHGDCFLLALPRDGGGTPYYVLIDCGYKPGSPAFVHKKKIEETIKHIGQATNNHIDLFIITHEHQDHLNGIWNKVNSHFKDFQIDRAWFAWTEDPTDPLANELREIHKDQLLGLVEARHQLALAMGENNSTINRLDSLLSLEFGGDSGDFNLRTMRLAATDPSKSQNKQAIKFVRDKAMASKGVRYLTPGEAVLKVEGAKKIRAYILGPPRDAELIKQEDPIGSEGFPGHEFNSRSFSFTAAVHKMENCPPFREQFRILKERALKMKFYKDFYGKETNEIMQDNVEVPANASWRRIDSEWLYAADSLALKLNSGINNTSLVVAFELPQSRKILLFAADAQRGNWVSWSKHTWNVSGKKVTARDILSRTVLYKVGHHGSHNATLNGTVDDQYPNLSWMGLDTYASEFTAMITAVNKWALTKNDPPWRHPLPSIREALEQKTQGRLFQTDTDELTKPSGVSNAAWKKFLSRTASDKLYFDYTIMDE